jgi:hypothetical protein
MEKETAVLVVPPVRRRRRFGLNAREFKFEVAAVCLVLLLVVLVAVPYPLPLHVTGTVTAATINLELSQPLELDPDIEFAANPAGNTVNEWPQAVVRGVTSVKGLDPVAGARRLKAKRIRMASITAGSGAHLLVTVNQPGRMTLAVAGAPATFVVEASCVFTGRTPSDFCDEDSDLAEMTFEGAGRGIPLTLDFAFKPPMLLDGLPVRSFTFGEPRGGPGSPRSFVSSVKDGLITVGGDATPAKVEPGGLVQMADLKLGSVQVSEAADSQQLLFSGQATGLTLGSFDAPDDRWPSLLGYLYSKSSVRALGTSVAVVLTLLFGTYQWRRSASP